MSSEENRLRRYKNRAKMAFAVTVVAILLIQAFSVAVTPMDIYVDVNTDLPYTKTFDGEYHIYLHLENVTEKTILVVTFTGADPDTGNNFGSLGAIDDENTIFVFTILIDTLIEFETNDGMTMKIEKIDLEDPVKALSDCTIKGYTYEERYRNNSAMISLPDADVNYYNVTVSPDLTLFLITDGRISLIEDVDVKETFELPPKTDHVIVRSENEEYFTMKVEPRTYEPSEFNLPPEAVCGLDQTVYLGEEVVFNASHSNDWDGYIAQYDWNFGDGSSGSGKEVSHTYYDPGLYPVTLFVTDDDGDSDSDNLIVTVLNKPPSVDANAVVSGMTATFTATAVDYENVTYFWEFGDGATSEEQNPVHIYQKMGTYPVKLTCTDEHGTSGYDWLYVEVTNTPPVVDARGPYVGYEGSPVAFFGYAFDAESTNLIYEWDLDGDGFVDSTLQNPTWTWYDDYEGEVTLTVTDEGGASASDTAHVSVLNEDPIVTISEVYTLVDFKLTIAGEKWNKIDFILLHGDEEVLKRTLMRETGKPQTLTITDAYVDFTGNTTARVIYKPEEDPPKGTPYGANPVQMRIIFKDGTVYELKHTFRTSANTGLDAQIWDVVVNPYVHGHELTYVAIASDVGVFDLLTFTWDFGDGTVVSHSGYIGYGEDTARYTHTSSGTYTISVLVEDGDGGMGSDSVTYTFDIDEGGGGGGFVNNPPIASASCDKTTAAEDEVIYFSSAGTSDPDGHSLTYYWNFGDGDISDLANPHHSYSRSGTYNVRLWVFDSYGALDTADLTITVYNVPPTASAGDDVSVFEDELVIFDGSLSYDTPSDRLKLKYYWDFGDGMYANGMVVNHTYHNEGTYIVTLTVEDDNGITSNDTLLVTVTNIPPSVDAGSDMEVLGSNVYFYGIVDDTVSDMPLLVYTWDFGDGSNSSTPIALHSYSFSGTYTATLTAVDDNGASISDSIEVIVHMDADSDGMLDEWEMLYGLDPNDGTGDNGPNGDPDNDGLSNFEEYEYGTDPMDFDTDDDGLGDGDETGTYLISPLDSDNDDDGLDDSEVIDWFYYCNITINVTFFDSEGSYSFNWTKWPKETYRATILAEFISGEENNTINISVDGSLVTYDEVHDGLNVTYTVEFTLGDVLQFDSAITEFGVIELLIKNMTVEKKGLDPLSDDTDGDGLSDYEEFELGLAPGNVDSDDDLIWDSVEIEYWQLFGFTEEEAVSMAKIGDFDSDDLSDGLEILFNIDPLDPDPDGDGMNDWAELFQYIPMIIQKMNMTLENDSLTLYFDIEDKDDYMIKFVKGEGNSTITITLNGAQRSFESGVGYYMFTEKLFPDNYTLVFSIIGSVLLEEFIVYRMGLHPFKTDWDEDGLEDGMEVKLGANPYKEDTDGDGLTDGDEYHKYETDPTKYDSDDDGLSDYEELTKGIDDLLTDPMNPDTDSDGLWDGYTIGGHYGELSYGANATDPDSDDDTMPDGWEVKYGLNPIDSSDATLDKDWDGLDNAQEYTVETTVDDSDTDDDGLVDGDEIMGVLFRTNIVDGASSTDYYDKQNGDKWIVWDGSGYGFESTSGSDLVEAETKIAYGTGNQHSPHIYGDQIVYVDDSDGDNDIYLHNISNGTTLKITKDIHKQESPVIYGNYIVWVDWRSGADSDIYMFDIEEFEETQITSGNGNQKNPYIHENRIVWEDYRNASTGADIFTYNIKVNLTSRITNSSADQKNPSIFGDNIVWVDMRHGTSEIYANRDGSEVRITNDSYTQHSPVLEQNLVFWVDERESDTEIFAFNLLNGLTTRITDDNDNQRNPAISGNKITWETDVNGNWDIYLNDLTTGLGLRITNNTSSQEKPSISEDTVVWQDFRHGSWDVMMFACELLISLASGAPVYKHRDRDEIYVWKPTSTFFKFTPTTLDSSLKVNEPLHGYKKQELYDGPDPFNFDSDGDGVIDGHEPDWDLDTDSDGIIDSLDTDSDGDGVPDNEEVKVGYRTNAENGEYDEDSWVAVDINVDDDIYELFGFWHVPSGAPDVGLTPVANLFTPEGVQVYYSGFTDRVRIGSDYFETSDSLNIELDISSNSRFSPDRKETYFVVESALDSDTIKNIVDVDSDGDGIEDGTEPIYYHDSDDDGTWNMLDLDSDSDGISDGDEDKDFNGKVDFNETSEINVDSDGDGIWDKEEPLWNVDVDGDGQMNAADTDSDGDGLPDNYEIRIVYRTNGEDGEYNSDSWIAVALDTDCWDETGYLPDGFELTGFEYYTTVASPSGNIIGETPESESIYYDGTYVYIDNIKFRANATHPDIVNDTAPVWEYTNADQEVLVFIKLSFEGIYDMLDDDCDDDLLLDGIEDDNQNGIVDTWETNPWIADTDGDNIIDGIEDTNRDGRWNLNETYPILEDTDFDGLWDGFKDLDGDGIYDVGVEFGEDLDCDGEIDPGETDPLEEDTDFDGLGDAEEVNECTFWYEAEDNYLNLDQIVSDPDATGGKALKNVTASDYILSITQDLPLEEHRYKVYIKANKASGSDGQLEVELDNGITLITEILDIWKDSYYWYSSKSLEFLASSQVTISVKDTGLRPSAYVDKVLLVMFPEQNTNSITLWHMDESSWSGIAEEVIDQSSNGNHGTAVNGPTTASGKIGMAGDFEASSSHYVEVPDAANLDISGNITLEAWVYLESYTGNHQSILSKGNAYNLMIGRTTHTAQMEVRIGGNWVARMSSTEIPLGTWTHIAGTYNHQTGLVQIFINGVEENGTNQNNPSMGHIESNSHPLWIGANPTVWGRYFDGLIDEVSIYDRCLSGEIILYHCNILGKGRFYMDGSDFTTYLSIPKNSYVQSTQMTLTPSLTKWSDMELFSAGNRPNKVVIGDLDCDGDNDFAITHYGSGTVGIFRQNPDHSWSTMESLSAGIRPRGIAIGDLDCDGDNDLAVVNSGSNTVGIFKQNTDHSWSTMESLAVGAIPYYIAIGDLDCDGDNDIAVGHDGNKVIVFRQNGDHSWTKAWQLTTGNDPQGIAIDDLDGDGDNDLAVAIRFEDTVVLFRQNSDHSWTLKESLHTGFRPYDVKIGDLDGDGDNDIAVGHNSNKIGLFKQNSDHSWTSMEGLTVVPSGHDTYNFDIGDMDCDGDNDIVFLDTSHYTSGPPWVQWYIIGILRQNGDHSWDDMQSLIAGDPLTADCPMGIAIGDLDCDGDNDISVVHDGHNSFGLFKLFSPVNPTLDVGADGDLQWYHDGGFSSQETFPDFANEINKYIFEHKGEMDAQDNYYIPLKFHSDTPCWVSLSNINIVLDALVSDPNDYDTDSDGLSDGSELEAYNTNPMDIDSDNDNIQDGVELVFDGQGIGSDPADHDTDGDGLWDGFEDLDGDGEFDPLTEVGENLDTDYEVDYGETHPLDPDTDDDRLLDGNEKIPFVMWFEAENYTMSPSTQKVEDSEFRASRDYAATSSTTTPEDFVSINQELTSDSLHYKLYIKARKEGTSDGSIEVHVNGDLKGTLNIIGEEYHWDSVSSFDAVNTVAITLKNISPSSTAVYVDKVMLVNVSRLSVTSFVPSGSMGGSYLAPMESLNIAGDGPQDVAIGDLDGDGDNDMAVANKDSDTVGIFIHEDGAWRGMEQELASLWHLNENSGNTAYDETISHNDGTIYNGASWVSGKFGSALKFDGDDDHVMVNPYDGFPSTELTVEFWMNSSDSTKAGTPISYAVPWQANEFILLNYKNFEFWIKGKYVVTGVTANDGEWHHIAVTWQSSDGSFVIYKDGEEAYTNTLQQGAVLTDGGALVIGQEQDGVGGGFQVSQAFLGLIDEVAIFNRVLSAQEIKDYYDRGWERYYKILEAGNEPRDIAIGDLDNDGDNDIAVANSGSDTLGLFKQNSDHSWSNMISYSTAGNPYQIAIGDLDDDGDNDIAVANSGSDTVQLFILQNGILSKKLAYYAGEGLRGIAVGDLNGDDLNDIAVANSDSDTVGLLMQNSDHSWSRKPSLSTGRCPEHITIEDLDGDGESDDIAVTNAGSRTVGLFIRDGSTWVSEEQRITSLWHMNENSGSLVSDETETHNDGRINGGASWVTGKFESGLEFDGNDDYVIMESFDNFPSTEITIGFWMKSSDTTKEGTPISYAVPGSDNEFLLYNYQDFEIYIKGTRIITGVSANNGKWQYIAVTWRSADGKTVLYKEGFPAWTGIYKQGATLTSGGTFVLGQEQDNVGGDFEGYQAFQGIMDEVVIYDKVLSSQEIKDYYALGSGLEHPSNALDLGCSPGGLAVADMDGDGDRDVAVTDTQDNTVKLFEQHTDHSWSFVDSYYTGYHPRGMDVGDLDADGDNDIAVANYWSDTAGLLRRFDQEDVLFTSDMERTVSDSSWSGIENMDGPEKIPNHVAIGDLDCDGDNDIAITIMNSYRLGIYRQLADGTFGPMESLYAGTHPNHIQIGDIDGDGDNDIVHRLWAAGMTMMETVHIKGQTAPGVFTSMGGTSLGKGYPRGGDVALGDLDNDGDMEIAATHRATNTLKVIFYKAGSLDVLTLGAGLDPKGIAIGDMDGDGLKDIVVANSGSQSVGVFYNMYQGTTWKSMVSIPIGCEPLDVAIGDLDGDGDNDISVANSGSDNIGLLINNPHGDWGYISYNTADAPTEIAIDDLNGDSLADIAVSNLFSNIVGVFMQNADHSFSCMESLAAGSRPEGIAIGDLDSDGDNDIAVVNTWDKTLGIFTQQEGDYEFQTSTGGNRQVYIDIPIIGTVPKYVTSATLTLKGCQFDLQFPKETYMNLGDNRNDTLHQWAWLGEFKTTATTLDLAGEINSYIARHLYDVPSLISDDGYMRIPITFYSETGGFIKITDVDIKLGPYVTDAMDFDTDSDWMPDGEEVNVWGTNSLSSDSDNDGLFDVVEPMARINTNPADSDSENDIIGDGEEVNVIFRVGALSGSFEGYDTDTWIAITGMKSWLLSGETFWIPDIYNMDLKYYEFIRKDSSLPDIDKIIYNAVGEYEMYFDQANDSVYIDTKNGYYSVYELASPPPEAELSLSPTMPYSVLDQEIYANSALEEDQDNDGIVDGLELPTINGLDSNDADVDDDGLLDGFEYYILGTDPTDPDTDDDGLPDGTEMGITINDIFTLLWRVDLNKLILGTNIDSGNFTSDEDPKTRTDPLRKDTDRDGAWDGFEDKNHNGIFEINIDFGEDVNLNGVVDIDALGYFIEADPNNIDTDFDGVLDSVEMGVPGYDLDFSTTTSAVDIDTDDDGLIDGEEDRNHNGRVDAGESDPNDVDTDSDSLWDGLELGRNLTNIRIPRFRIRGTNTSTSLFGGHYDHDTTTTTDPVDVDTDGDGIPDGWIDGWLHPGIPSTCHNITITNMSQGEDLNFNGVFDEGETDPLNWDTDFDWVEDGFETTVDGFDPFNDTDAYKDYDNDSWENMYEYRKEYDLDLDDWLNVFDKDDDGDSLSTENETTYGMDPFFDDRGVDSDLDGILNIDEYYAGLYPWTPDTDEDGLWDGYNIGGHNGEASWGTDPLDPDTDEDGFEDGMEVNGYEITYVYTKGEKQDIVKKIMYGDPLVPHKQMDGSWTDSDDDSIPDLMEKEPINTTTPGHPDYVPEFDEKYGWFVRDHKDDQDAISGQFNSLAKENTPPEILSIGVSKYAKWGWKHVWGPIYVYVVKHCYADITVKVRDVAEVQYLRILVTDRGNYKEFFNCGNGEFSARLNIDYWKDYLWDFTVRVTARDPAGNEISMDREVESWFAGLMKAIWEALKDAFEAIWEFILEALNFLWELMLKMVKAMLEVVLKPIFNLMKGLVGGLVNVFNDLCDTYSYDETTGEESFNPLAFLPALLGPLMGPLETFIEVFNIVSTILDILITIIDLFTSGGGVSALLALASLLAPFIISLFISAVPGVGEALNSVENAAGDGLQYVVNFLFGNLIGLRHVNPWYAGEALQIGMTVGASVILALGAMLLGFGWYDYSQERKKERFCYPKDEKVKQLGAVKDDDFFKQKDRYKKLASIIGGVLMGLLGIVVIVLDWEVDMNITIPFALTLSTLGVIFGILSVVLLHKERKGTKGGFSGMKKPSKAKFVLECILIALDGLFFIYDLIVAVQHYKEYPP
ncbi:MAG: PKD domain-containing protein [Thermoplasmata archaeon]|nr:MAG: PKD domain-containing protein [Thermoplasmata archaeon]